VAAAGGVHKLRGVHSPLGHLSTFVQQRIGHFYRRQRPTPLPGGVAGAVTKTTW